MVWALPLSLATTKGITIVFFSSGYLDVSVHRVSLLQSRIFFLTEERVAPFGDPRITGYFHLPVAYRRLSRPSSPLRAKASTIRSYLLYFFTLRYIFFSQYVKEPYTITGIGMKLSFALTMSSTAVSLGLC